jgi:ATP-dependent RNA helicase RhlE
MSFDELHVNPLFLKVLNQQRITAPTPIQTQSIPPAMEGRDVVAIAQTGTGKTLAFALGAMHRLAEDRQLNKTRMLVLTPTRELAHQVHDVIAPLARTIGARTVCVYGGVGMENQAQGLRRGATIIVATPGRLLDHMSRGNVRFNDLSILILDEADRMLDMGFMPDIKRIMAKLPAERQTMMFSATFPKEIAALTTDMQHNPVRVEIGTIARPVDAVRQGVYTVDSEAKLDLLTRILKDKEVVSALIFLRTKHRTDRVARALDRAGFKAQAIHGGRSQRQRQQALDGFKQGRFNILVATDVAARGIDVQGITHVVNFDIPNTSDDYVHRIGRTARASATGDAITFVSPEDHIILGSIERALGKNIPREDWEGSVHVPSRFNPNRAQDRPMDDEYSTRKPFAGRGRRPFNGGGRAGQHSARPRTGNGGGGRRPDQARRAV